MKTTSNEIAVVNEVAIQAPIHLVWYAWTISGRVSVWFAPEAVVEAKEGGVYELYFIPGNKNEMNIKGCKIIKLAEEKELQFTWKGPDQFAPIMNNEHELTVVKVSFESLNEESSKVKLEHTGFKTSGWRLSIGIKWPGRAF